jgi:hypothetical protein
MASTVRSHIDSLPSQRRRNDDISMSIHLSPGAKRLSAAYHKQVEHELSRNIRSSLQLDRVPASISASLTALSLPPPPPPHIYTSPRETQLTRAPETRQELADMLEEYSINDSLPDRPVTPPPPYGEDLPGVNTHPVDIHVQELDYLSGEIDRDAAEISLEDCVGRAGSNRRNGWIGRRKAGCKQFLKGLKRQSSSI